MPTSPTSSLVEPAVYADARGFFFETYHADKYRDARHHGRLRAGQSLALGRAARCAGCTRSVSGRRRSWCACSQGEIFDVAVDVRRGLADLRALGGQRRCRPRTRSSCYIPPGFLHGFCVLSAEAEVEYKCSAPYAPGDELGVVWNDPDLCIAWPVTAPLLSAKDAALPRLADVLDRLPR